MDKTELVDILNRERKKDTTTTTVAKRKKHEQEEQQQEDDEETMISEMFGSINSLLGKVASGGSTSTQGLESILNACNTVRGQLEKTSLALDEEEEEFEREEGML